MFPMLCDNAAEAEAVLSTPHSCLTTICPTHCRPLTRIGVFYGCTGSILGSIWAQYILKHFL